MNAIRDRAYGFTRAF